MFIPFLLAWQRGSRLALAALGFAATMAGAAPGDLDTRFGTGGFIGLRPSEGDSWSPVVGLSGRLHQLEAAPGDCGSDACSRYRLIDWSVDGRVMLASPTPLASGSFQGRVQRLASGDLLLPFVDSSRSHGLQRVDPTGLSRTGFGTDGTAWTGVQFRRQATSREVATQVVAVAEPAAGGLLVLHAFNCLGGTTAAAGSPAEGASSSEAWGVPLEGHPCQDVASWEGVDSLARLRSDGSIDPDFPWGGASSLAGIGPLALLAVRGDASIVLADRYGRIRVLEASGAERHAIQLDLSDMTGVSLADGSLWMVGTRGPQRELWIARLYADLTPDGSIGQGSGLERLDLSLVLPGRTDLSAWPMEMVADPLGDGLYLSTNLATSGDRDYLCAGVVRISLPGKPDVDQAFGRGGFACVTRTGLDYRRSRISAAPDGSVFLSFPDQHLLDTPKDGLKTVRLRTDLAAQGAGLISIQGMSSTWSGDSLAITVGRSSGNVGEAGIRWRAFALRYFVLLPIHAVPDRSRVQSAGPLRESSVQTVPSAEVLAEGRLEWPTGASADAQFRISLPASVRAPTTERCALRSIQIVLDDPAGGVAYSRSIHRVDVPLPIGVSACLPQSGVGYESADDGGGGAFGTTSLFALLGLASFRLGGRQRRLPDRLIAACRQQEGHPGKSCYWYSWRPAPR